MTKQISQKCYNQRNSIGCRVEGNLFNKRHNILNELEDLKVQLVTKLKC